MEIKTVWRRAEYRKVFDEEVNINLALGYEIERIEILEPKGTNNVTMLFALMYKK